MAVYTGALTGSLQFSSGSTTYEIKPTSNNIEVIGGLHVSGSSGLLVNGRNIITSIDNLQSGSSPQVGALNLFTGSIAAYTASISTHTGSVNTELGVLRTKTGSLETNISTLTAATSSYITNALTANFISSSQQIKDLGFQSGSDLISSSAQITGLGFISESSAGTVSSSAQISGLGFITGSTYSGLVSIPSGILSSSAQVTALGFGSSSAPAGTISSSAQVTAFGFISQSDSTAALNTFSASIQGEVDSLQAASSSYALKTGISGSFKVTSASLASSIASNTTELGVLRTKTGSLDTNIATNTTEINVLSAATSSYALKSGVSGSFAIVSASLADRIIANNEGVAAINAGTSSFAIATNVVPNSTTGSFALKSDISGSFTIASASLASSITSAETDITTNAGGITRLTAATGSYALSATSALKSQISGAFDITSASLATRINNVGSGETGSLISTGSVDLNTLTFTKGDGSTFDLTVHTGSVESGVSAYSDLTGVPSNIVSSSNQISSDVSGSFTLASSSLASAIATNLTNINTNTTEINVLSAATSSYALSSTTALKSEVSGAFAVTSASLASNIATNTTEINVLSAATSSYALSSGVVANASTSSLAVKTEVSGAFAVTSASLASRIASNDTDISTNTTEINVLSAATSSYALSSAVVANASTSSFVRNDSNQTITGNLTVTGDLTAQEFNTEFVSSSVIFESGSTIFGNSNDDIHAFTGSIRVSGSIDSDLIPATDSAYDLGSLTKKWKDLYLSGSTIFLGDTKITRNTSGDLEVRDRASSALRKIKADEIELGTTGQRIRVVGNKIKLTNSGGATRALDLPGDIISSSAQIAENISGSFTATSASLATSIKNNLTEINVLSAATSSYLSSVPSGTVSGSAQISASAAASGFSNITYDGNKVISQTHLPGFFTSSFNPGTSGSITEFLDAIFFPNTAPSITTGNQTIAEFTTADSTIVTVAGTDPEGQSLTFGTSSAYTANFVKVASNGVMTLNTLATASMNTEDRGDGTDAHPIILKATDTFGATVNKTIYLTVTPNAAPVWRLTGPGGNVLTNGFSASRNENASAGEVAKIYFTDAEGDTITITSQSDSTGHFSLTKSSNYVSVTQVTASLDYEAKTSYTFSVTASDEHAVAGQDVDAVARLPITITVVDNATPSISNQNLGSINEDSDGGTTVGTISASDPEGDTITFSNFTLKSLALDGSNVAKGTYSGTSQKTDPTEDAFQMNSSGVVIRKAGVVLNSDLINSYVYRASVSDPFNGVTASADISMSIADDQALSIGGLNTFYLIESALSGSSIYDDTSGYTGTTARFTSNQSPVTWSVKPTSDFAVTSDGYLKIARNISGSGDVGGDTLTGQITGSNDFGTETKSTFTVNLTDNVAPTITFSDTSANQNTNGARPSNTLVTITFSDTEGDTIDFNSFTASFAGAALSATKVGSTYEIRPTAKLSAGTYQITASIADTASFATRTSTDTFTITQSPIGTLTTNGTFRIIESAESGSNIVTNINGRTGTQGDLGVTYSPQHNSAAVTSFTSSNAAIAVNSSGNLTLNSHLSGSTTGSGAVITSTITYQDQFNNLGSGSISIAVRPNLGPTASFSDVSANLTASIDIGTNLSTVTITDEESDTPFSMSLSGAGASKLQAVPQNANSSSYQIQASTAITAAETITYNAVIEDNFGKETTYSSRTFEVAAARGLVYFYSWDGGSAANEATAIASLGDSGGDNVGVEAGSVIDKFASGSIGSASFNPSYVGGTVSRVASKSLDDMSDSNSAGLSTLGYANFTSGGAKRLLILFPSASNLDSKPVSMYDGVPPDSTGTAGEFYVYAKDAAIAGTIGTGVYYFPLHGSFQSEGYDKWGMIFAEGENTNNSRYFLMPDSASAP